MKLFKARAGDICKEGSFAGKAGMRRAERDGESAWRASCGAFYVFFAYTIFIWCCESADLACWLAGVRQATLLSRLAALLLALLIAGKAAGIPKCENVQPDRFFALGCMAITLFFAAKSIRPDMSYDTQNYHLLSQIPGFVDNLHYHAMPGRFQMFGFRLGDRMFYPFRLLLGLRMGTLLNAAALLVLYRQVTVFLEWFGSGPGPGSPGALAAAGEGKGMRAKWAFWRRPSFLAFFLVCRFEVLQESGSYMVELAALPFFFEMIFLLVRRGEEAAGAPGGCGVLPVRRAFVLLKDDEYRVSGAADPAVSLENTQNRLAGPVCRVPGGRGRAGVHLSDLQRDHDRKSGISLL